MPAEVFGLDLLMNYLLVGAILLVLGMVGFLARRNMIVMFLSAELMLQGTALTLIGFGRYHGNWTGQVLTIFILTVAACEAALALALILVLYNRRSTLDISLWGAIREPGLPAPDEEAAETASAEPLDGEPSLESYPSLTVAGNEPTHPTQPWIARRD